MGEKASKGNTKYVILTQTNMNNQDNMIPLKIINSIVMTPSDGELSIILDKKLKIIIKVHSNKSKNKPEGFLYIFKQMNKDVARYEFNNFNNKFKKQI